MSVGLVLVSHSATLAKGVAEVAGQMAADVQIIPAGGLDDGGIGTSYDLVDQGVEKLRGQNIDVLLLSDLGSATMTIETVIDMRDDERIVFADAPFVEGAVAAAVAAQQGKSLADCADVAREAAAAFNVEKAPDVASTEASGDYEKTATVVDEAGLHARPAAQVADMAGAASGEILLNGVSADSIMSIMALGIGKGETVTISTADPQSRGVVDQIADAISQGLD